MSERLNQLATRLKKLSESIPVDATNSESMGLLMCWSEGKVLANAFQENANIKKKRKLAKGAIDFANNIEILGEKHMAVKILRGMGLIANAIIEGKPEPTDEELGIASKCFVVTVCYDTPDCAEVQMLCRFRDEVLLTSPFGRFLIDLYYHISPFIVRWISSRPKYKRIVRKSIIQPLIKQLENKYLSN